MSSLAYESAETQNRLLNYLRGLPHNHLWWKSNVSSAAQWAVKFGLILTGIAVLRHGLLVNFGVGLCWDAAAFLVNFRFWRKGRQDLRRCSAKSARVWGASQVKNQGWTLLFSGLIGLPLAVTKLVLIPEGFLMSFVMFWVNDRYIFGDINFRELLAARFRKESCQTVAAAHAAIRRTIL
ncbi:MAG TPA: hypothetical protein VFH37_03660 [Candidatus Saccharimonadales bacterium]|nr:hypothetical protein [Candidatus Saccharimonadales bacterium]